MVYYGLSLNTGNLGGSFYLNFTISGLVEFPAYTLCLLLLDRIGRKWLHCIVMVVGGLACISTVFTTIFGGDGNVYVFYHKCRTENKTPFVKKAIEFDLMGKNMSA